MVLILLAWISLGYSLSCLDANGEAKDYWIMIKGPQIANIPPLPGKSYIYLDEQNLGYQFAPLPLNQSSAMVKTINQINADNDCPAPACPDYNFGNGHLKGILAYTSTQAIFIMHSFPQFPNVSASNYSNSYLVTTDIGDSQMMYGQDMFCVELKTSDLFNIAGLMSIALPNVYASRITQPNANISLLISNHSISSAPYYAGYKFTTPNGFVINYFSKAGSSNLDIYEYVISPYYKIGMMCETWGRPYEDDFCPPNYLYKNLNIDEVSFGKYWWTSDNDHSKWGIGINSPLVCYSDMNRMTTQWVRGGGSLCMMDQKLYNYQKSIAVKYDSC